MKIELKRIPIRDVMEGYVNDDEEGVVGYGGKLNIRPKYQREFVYKGREKELVVVSVQNEWPLNVMYWVETDDGEGYELLDGQQRTISICEYVAGNYSIDYRAFHNLTEEEKEQILDYELMVYICNGTHKDVIDWFKVINIAGKKLTNQELRNAVYSGEWITDAKRYFSKTGCPADDIGGKYLSGSSIRQAYLESVLKWKAHDEDLDIEGYMSKMQHEQNARGLWRYFEDVLSWVEYVYPVYRREMQKVDWGILYNQFKDNDYDGDELEEKVKELMMDEDVTNKGGIYAYLLDGKERNLNIRSFNNNMRREMYEKQDGKCISCEEEFPISGMHADHIIPWSDGGKTTIDNCQILCRYCNNTKSNR